MRKMTPKLLALAIMLLTLFAQVFSASACAVSAYQPEVPPTLRK
ncbi:MAG: cyclic lactone autoinducer peptide [Syntrophomonadaceae bacterium]|nr:cyclic lactone autoinducer peptide [Syntrophomonadaceae bacterium]